MTTELDDHDLREPLLAAFLGNVVFDGWSDVSLAAAAKTVGVSPEMARNAFPGGLLEVAEFFSARADRDMAARLAETDMAGLRIRDRIVLGVRTRIEVLIPDREAVRALVGFLARPGHQAASAACMWRTASEIWYAAGDASADFNYYTKRGSLVPVYGATVLYWLADDSEGYSDTWDFLGRRVDEVVQMIMLRMRAEKAVKEFSPARFFEAFRAKGFTRRTGRYS